MKLLFKFNLIFLAVFGLGLVATGYTAHRFLSNNARDQVLQQARLMMETTMASRTYTTKQIRPLLEQRQGTDFLSANGASLCRHAGIQFPARKVL